MEIINERLEAIIEDLSYTKDKIILSELNHYPVLATTAHTRPFRKKWLNIIAGLIIPLGIFFYIRMLRFRMRLYRDLRTIRHTSDHIVERINNM
jgi:lipopolysaccharide export system permease protein